MCDESQVDQGTNILTQNSRSLPNLDSLLDLSKVQPQSTPHSTIDLHLYHGFGSLGTSSLGRRRLGFGSFVIGLYGGGINVVEFDCFGTDNVLSE